MKDLELGPADGSWVPPRITRRAGGNGRTELFSGVYWRMGNMARTTYDYDRVNDRFLLVDPQPSVDGGEDTASVKIAAVVDWFDELKRRVPGGR
jgi:hypothetical protein